jgi:TRAP-type mannitol/chloroaromatic compound transport system substrate-binding protein
MPRIIISYRRSDSAAMAGRIFDRLHAYYGDQSMFMDIDNIPFGTDFRRYIKDALGESDALVAVVGPRWLGPRDVGRPRIHDATDPVRLEIEGALERGIPIIPVLVDGAQMPSDAELPDSLTDFAFINAASVDTGRDFRPHMDRLIRGIEEILARTKTPAAKPDARNQSMSLQPPVPGEPVARRADAVPETEMRRPSDATSASTPSLMPGPGDGSDGASPEPQVARPYRYAALAAVVVVAIGLFALISRNWSSDSEPAVKSASPVSGPANVANRQEANAPRPVPTKIENQPANMAARPDPLPRLDPPGLRVDPPSAPSIKWRLQNTLPSKTPTGLPFFARRVAELSRGRMDIEVLAAGSIVPAFQIVDAVQQDVLDLGFGPGSLLYGKDRTFALMTAVPFGFAPVDQFAFRRRAATIFDRLMAQQNAVAVPCGSFGRNGELWLRKPLAKTADIVGAKLRFLGLAADVYRDIGASVILLPTGEIMPALERNVISGAQYGSPSESDALGLPDVAKHFYYPGVVTPTALIDLYVGKSKWDALGPVGRQIIEQACGEASDVMRAEHERADTLALEQFARRKVSVAALPVAVERDLYAASRRVLTRFSDENASFRAVMAIVDEMRGSTLAARLR